MGMALGLLSGLSLSNASFLASAALASALRSMPSPSELSDLDLLLLLCFLCLSADLVA